MSGNERTVSEFAFANSTVKSGYNVNPQDAFVLHTQLMNLDDVEKWVWVTITYEVLDGVQPDYKQGKQVFMTIGNPIAACGRPVTKPWGPSNLTANLKPISESFIERSEPWIAPQDGFILSTGGHMHDGGVSTEIFKNNERICNSIPHYSKAKAAHSHGDAVKRQQPSGPTAANADIEHIERQDACYYPTGIPLKKGDTMHLQVKYDFKEHPG
jgi:hypothetical protein